MYQKNFAQKNATDIILQLQEKLDVKDAEILSLKVQIEDLKAQKYAALKPPLKLKKEKIECELELVKAYDRIDSLQQTLQYVNEQSEKESRRATELAQSVENLERQLAARNDTTKLWLPQKVPAEEVQVVEIYGQDFMWITEKVKKIVIDVLGSVVRIRNDARDPLVSAVANWQIGQHLHLRRWLTHEFAFNSSQFRPILASSRPSHNFFHIAR